MKNFIPLFLVISLVFVLVNCSENPDYVYDSQIDNIYFNIRNTDGSILYSFADTTLDIVEVTLYLPVKVSGNRLPKDRSMKIGVVDAQTTAISGLHYAPLSQSYTIPADSGTFMLPVVLYNKDDILMESTVVLSLQLLNSDDFEVGFPHLNNANISFSARLEEPEWWRYWLGELGIYSRTKHFLFLISSGTKNLHNPAVDFFSTPKALYHISEYKAFLTNPFVWVGNNPEYALDKQANDDYLFYLKATPDKTYILKWENETGKYYFIDENGATILY